MTKRRPPLSYDNALTRIAALIGYDAMAEATGRQPRTVRNWGDPDAAESCPIDCAELLDLAYQAAGGDGAPMTETLMLRVEAARQSRFAGEVQLSLKEQSVAKESGEAIAALVAACRPGATTTDRSAAAREIEESITILTATLAMLVDDTGAGRARTGND